MKFKGWFLSTFDCPKFIVLMWEDNYSLVGCVDCTGFDSLGRFRKITITREEFTTAKLMEFELNGLDSLGG